MARRAQIRTATGAVGLATGFVVAVASLLFAGTGAATSTPQVTRLSSTTVHRAGATLVVSPASVVSGGAITVRGRTGTAVRRPVTVKVNHGAGWAKMAHGTTDRKGRFRFTSNVMSPTEQTVTVRVLAPRHRTKKRVWPKVATAQQQILILVPIHDSPSTAAPTTAAPTTAAPTTAAPTTAAPTTAAPTTAAPTTSASTIAVPTTSAPTTAAPTTESFGAFESQVLAIVNSERAKAGCGALKSQANLTASARGHSSYMAATGDFGHTTRAGVTMRNRIEAAGYANWTTIGENIAFGYSTPAEVMVGWMNSPGHRANILNCAFKELGVGVARNPSGTLLWTQNFGSRS